LARVLPVLEAPLRFPRLVGTLVTIGYLLVVLAACVAVPELVESTCRALGLAEAWRSWFAIMGWLAVALGLAVALKTLSCRPRRAFAVLVFVLLPIWGLILNQWLTGRCKLDCPDDPYRVFAAPEVYGLAVLHAATAGGYALSRRRAQDLPERAEPWITALLLCGILLHVAVAVQLLDLMPLILVFPVTLPLMAPVASVLLFWRELARRLRASGERYRSEHGAALGGGLLRAPLVLGAHALLQALWRGHPTAAVDVFARTCTHTFSQLPLELTNQHCGHYLCTVAACGHPGLVRPERFGFRRGKVIIVNRQLAIANAFEDLLHSRWPRFGRAARASYDRLAIPICRYIRRRWLADLVYVAMKPAELVFYLVLLAFDPLSPEARIERMYR